MFAKPGRLAQMVRASVLHTEGQRFESSIAHHPLRQADNSYHLFIIHLYVQRVAQRCAVALDRPSRQFVFAAITKDTGVFRSATNY